MKDLKKRTISGVIGVIILLSILLKGGIVLALGISFLSIIGLKEFYKALEVIELKPIYAMGYLFTILVLINNIFFNVNILLLVDMIMLFILLYYLFTDNLKITDASVTLLGILYIPFSFTHIYYLDKTNYIWLIFLLAFGSDTFAYFAGNLFGKNKLSPKISPNKTIEGSLGGIIGDIILIIIYNYFFEIGPIIKLVPLAIIGSVVSQLGDLIASKIKRTTGIKDYGNLIPGHGGVLDRFDSILLSAPVIYYYVEYILN